MLWGWRVHLWSLLSCDKFQSGISRFHCKLLQCRFLDRIRVLYYLEVRFIWLTHRDTKITQTLFMIRRVSIILSNLKAIVKLKKLRFQVTNLTFGPTFLSKNLHLKNLGNFSKTASMSVNTHASILTCQDHRWYKTKKLAFQELTLISTTSVATGVPWSHSWTMFRVTVVKHLTRIDTDPQPYWDVLTNYKFVRLNSKIVVSIHPILCQKCRVIFTNFFQILDSK